MVYMALAKGRRFSLNNYENNQKDELKGLGESKAA